MKLKKRGGNEYVPKRKDRRFNKLSIEDRKIFLQSLTAEQYEKFIGEIRRQAVIDFWNNERDLIKQGSGTREWTPEQMEAILNVGES